MSILNASDRLQLLVTDVPWPWIWSTLYLMAGVRKVALLAPPRASAAGEVQFLNSFIVQTVASVPLARGGCCSPRKVGALCAVCISDS
jgi:hypothetical protein